MFNKITYFFSRNTLLKVLSANSLAVFSRVITGFFTTKIIALLVGPSGLPLLSNFNNFINSTKNIATLGMQEGVVAQIAKTKNDTLVLKKSLSTAFFLVLITAMLVALVLFFGATYFNEVLFVSHNYVFIIKTLAVIMPFWAMQVFFIAVVNGFERYKKLIIITIITNLLTFGLTVFLIYNFQLQGALLALVFGQLVSLLLLLLFVKELQHSIQLISWANFDFGVLKSYASYSIMALVTAFTVPWMFIVARKLIITKFGIVQAGYWDAMLRISNFYLLFVATALSLYYLPKLATLTTDKAFFKEVKNYYKTLMPLFLLGLIVVYFLRKLIVHYFLTDAFMPTTTLFVYQLAADFFKVASLAFTYQFLAKKMLWQYVFTELFFVGIFYVLTHFVLSTEQLDFVVKAYFYTYVLYYFLILFLFRKVLFDDNKSF